VTYEPFGPVSGWTWGNSTSTVRSYDADGNVSVISSAGAKTYTYDNASRVTGTADSGNTALSWTYGYDLLDRLTSASTPTQTRSFTYDANGNRLTQGGSVGSTSTIDPASNRLSSVSGGLTRTYGYDASGNATSFGGTTFTYNAAGRLVSASNSSGAMAYLYNALGQRARKSSANTGTYFAYDEAGHLIGEYDPTGSLIQELVWLGDTPVATVRLEPCGLSVFYIHTDHLNTPRRITRRSTTDVVWSWESDPFGATTPNENPSGLGVFTFNLRLPGQYFDAETGLHYNYRRDYDPATGRYVEADPIRQAGGLNVFIYAANYPTARSDPAGLRSLRDFCIPMGLEVPRIESMIPMDAEIPGKIITMSVGASDLQITGVGPSVDWTPRHGPPSMGYGVDANVGVGMYILQEWTMRKGHRNKWIQEMAYWCIPNDRRNGQCLRPDESGYRDLRVVSRWDEDDFQDTIEQRWSYEPSGYRVNLP